MRIDRKSISEKGVASLMVTTVLILVIGLIVVGFSQVTRRNQRETLDRQLSTQAFYAAETAVNSVKAKIDSGAAVTEKNDCTTGAGYEDLAGVFTATDSRVTCLLVSGNLTEMYYPTVTDEDPTVAAVISNSGAIGTIILSWSNKDATPGPLGACNNNDLPEVTGWSCAHGLLRVDAVNTQSIATTVSNPALAAFFRPNTGAGGSNVNFAGGPSGGLVGVQDCTVERCRATITMPGGSTSSSYYLRMLSIYKDSSVTIEALNTSGNPIDLSGQVLVDATGASAGVLRRIQVRLPVANSVSNTPKYAIESTASICKRYVAAPGTPPFFQEILPAGAVCN